MKNLLLTILLLFTCTLGYSQVTGIQQLLSQSKLKDVVSQRQYISYGDIIWSEDFNGEKWAGTVTKKSYWELNNDSLGYILDTNVSLPIGWKFIDSTEHNFFWHWSDVGPRGRFTGVGGWYKPNNELLKTIPNPNSIQNGFLILESDYFNSNPSTPTFPDPFYNIHSQIECGPIDMSNYNGAIFNCKILCRLCCKPTNSVQLLISSDFNPISGKGTWKKYILSDPSPINELYQPYTAADINIDISEQVHGQDSVYFRIMNQDASHYYAIIDDIKFYAPPTHNLELKDAWADYLYPIEDTSHRLPFKSSNESFNFYGGYTQIPESIVGLFVEFRAAVYNFSTETAMNSKLNVKIFKDSMLDYKGVSSGIELNAHNADTLSLITRYTPSGIGNYQVSMILVQDATDELPENNGWEYNFQVTQNIYSRVTPGGESSFYSTGPKDWSGGGNPGDVCAQLYDVPSSIEQVQLSAIKVFIAPLKDPNDTIDIYNGELSMIGRIYKLNEYNQIEDTGIATDKYTLKINDTNSWVTIAIKNDHITLYGGESYLAGIETYDGSCLVCTPFKIGAERNALKQPMQGGLIYLTSKNEWYMTGDNYAINLIVEKYSQLVNVTFNLNVDESIISSNIFDPVVDTIYVTGSFADENGTALGWDEPGTGKSIMLTDNDGDFIYTATTQMEANIGDIEYKYFKNAGWEGPEWQGDPNRIATIGAVDVTINDSWCCGNAVKQNPLEITKLYPNPFNQNLIIESVVCGWEVAIRNLVGKTIFRKTIDESTIDLNLSKLENGIYFITISDRNGGSITYKILKNP